MNRQSPYARRKEPNDDVPGPVPIDSPPNRNIDREPECFADDRIYHHTDERVQAHVFVAALALLPDRALEKNLRSAGSQLSTPFAWQALETIRSVEVDLGRQRSKSCVTRGNKHATEALRVLGITQIDPPSPPENQQCLV